MSETPLNLAIAVGSVRPGRVGPSVSSWFADQAVKHGQFEVDVVDLVKNPPPLAITEQRPAELAEVTPILAAADAFVIVTPEYNHSFPAAIKSLIDWHHTEWRAKPVGFVSYGGQALGLRAVEALRLVLAEMHAVTIRDTVAFGLFGGDLGDDGQPRDGEGASTAAKAVLDQLAWWASALRQARATSTYPVTF